MEKTHYVTYEQFGAAGDGKTDDMSAIAAAHDYANEHGLSVLANESATYYIGGKNLTATVMTNTYWGKAKFTVDDTQLENVRQTLFCIQSAAKRFTPAIKSLRRNQRTVDFPHEGTVFVRVFSDQKRVYIRKGLNQNTGSDASDCFIVDGAGNVLNGINWDYETITAAYAFSTEDAPIVIDGGVFTTLANRAESTYNYHSRNLVIARSNVTVQNLTHYVEGEGDHGAPYSGFLTVGESYNVTLKNCLLTPHKTYRTESKVPGATVPMGSYDLNLSTSIRTRLIGIRQTRDINDSTYWGLMGSNFSKQVSLEECVMSRFDAHCGVTDGSIKRCRLGYMGLNLIGFGDFSVEDTVVCGRHFINFREDYGSFFHGSLMVKNCQWIPTGAHNGKLTVFRAENTGDHDFGYFCGMPETVTVDGLIIQDGALADKDLSYYLFPDYDSAYAPDKPFPYGTPKNVTVAITTASGKAVALCEDPALYPSLGNPNLA